MGHQAKTIETQRRSLLRMAKAGLVAAAAVAFVSCGGEGAGAGATASTGAGGSGGGSTSTSNFPPPTYTPAAKGDPQGAATTQVIDATGGSVTSADGGITLDIPAGALASATTISIQPITNTAPNGSGLAFRLEPEGTTFAVPVKLTFHLSGNAALAIDSTFIATQHADGLWYSQPNQTRDSSAQTVAVRTTHFSDWGAIPMLVLVPNSPRARTGATLALTAQIVYVAPTDGSLLEPVDDLAAPGPVSLDRIVAPRVWEVNDVVNGNAIFGQISDPGAFYAPGTVPTPNPVTVKVTAQLDTTRAIALDSVTIFDQEVWSGTTDITQTDGTKIHADVTFASDPNPPRSSQRHLKVLSGTAKITIPPTNSSSGCAQSISPDTHVIAPDEGSMTVTYDLANGPENANVQGGGTTAWPATMTAVCSNGTEMVQTTAAAAWWPIDPTNPLQTFTATNGVLNATISTLTASGTVQLVRQ